MNRAWGLPRSVCVNGVEYSINPEALKIEYILELYQSAEYETDEKNLIMLRVFYRNWETIPPDDYLEALQVAFDFIDGGRKQSGESGGAEKTLVHWAQDLPLIIATINTMLGRDIRTESLHWWTFLGYYENIPSESLFSLIISVRSKLRKGQLKDKTEREFYRKNKHLIDIRHDYSAAEKEAASMWGIKL